MNESNRALRRLEILDIEEKPVGYLDVRLSDEFIPRVVKPGQFVMVRVRENNYPLLPRPFAVVDVNRERGEFRLVIKIVGIATSLMKSLRVGDSLYVTGPLGRGIELKDSGISRVILLLRGVGSASATFLARCAFEMEMEVYTFLSASTSKRLVCRDLLKRYSTELFIATDDGSEGYGGNAIELVEDFLSQRDVDAVYTCGSRRFARYVERGDISGRFKGYVFLERSMACGVGFCHGCAVAKRNGKGYFLVCKDGPVFRVGEVMLDG